jgi:hypothetical protein
MMITGDPTNISDIDHGSRREALAAEHETHVLTRRLVGSHDLVSQSLRQKLTASLVSCVAVSNTDLTLLLTVLPISLLTLRPC